MKILCSGALDQLKDPVQALQIQEFTSTTHSDGICLVAITIVITTWHQDIIEFPIPAHRIHMN